jgi:plastocyanin
VSRPSASTPPPPRRLARGGAALAIAAAFLTGCGGPSGSDADSTAAPTTTTGTGAPTSADAGSTGEVTSITVTEQDFDISVDEDGLAAGDYAIEVVNEGSATHDLVVERDGEDVAASATIAPGGSTTVTVELEAGDYVFYCSIGNHREMGMEIDVTVG